VPTVRVVAESSLPPERVLEAAHDFSERRAEVWPAVSVGRLEVHEVGDTWADVTEGTRAGPVVNWERCRYDWSQPGSVKATVTDSNVYAFPGSSWEIKATPKNGGSQVQMMWVREFKRSPKGRLFGTAFRRLGNKLFGKYARDTLENLEKLETGEKGPAA
jgi:Polyketide cyclase / dehydrase and lipid transport